MKSNGYRNVLSLVAGALIFSTSAFGQFGQGSYRLSKEDLITLFEYRHRQNDKALGEVHRRAGGTISAEKLESAGYRYDREAKNIWLGNMNVTAVDVAFGPNGQVTDLQVTGNVPGQFKILNPANPNVAMGPGGLWINTGTAQNPQWVMLTADMLRDPRIAQMLQGVPGLVILPNGTIQYGSQIIQVPAPASSLNPTGPMVWGNYPAAGTGTVGGNTIITTPGRFPGGVGGGFSGSNVGGGMIGGGVVSGGLQVVGGHQLINAYQVFPASGGASNLLLYLKSDLIGHTRLGKDKYSIQKKDIATYSIKGANGGIDYAIIQVNLPGNNHNSGRILARKGPGGYYLINETEYNWVKETLEADQSSEAKKFKKTLDGARYKGARGYNGAYAQIREHAMTYPELQADGRSLAGFLAFNNGSFSINNGQLLYVPQAFNGAQAQPMVIFNGQTWNLPQGSVNGTVPVFPGAGAPASGSTSLPPASGVQVTIERAIQNPQIINWGTANAPKWMLEIPVKTADGLYYRYEYETLAAGEVKDGKLILSAARLNELKNKYPGVDFASVGIQSVPVNPGAGGSSSIPVTPASGTETVVVTWKDGARTVQILDSVNAINGASKVRWEAALGTSVDSQGNRTAIAASFTNPKDVDSAEAIDQFNDMNSRVSK